MLASLANQTDLEARIAGDARSIPEWASTHPDPASRVRNAQQLASRYGAGGVRNADAFMASVDGVLYGDDPAQGVVEGRQFLHPDRSEEHTSELPSLMRISSAVFCLKKKNNTSP